MLSVLTALQITTFLVFAIIGCVFTIIQMIVAAAGASKVDDTFGDIYLSDCRSTSTSCNEVSRVSVKHIVVKLATCGHVLCWYTSFQASPCSRSVY